jgi:hypothetical protein
MVNHERLSLRRRMLLSGFAALAASAVTGANQVMAAVEKNTLKRRGVGLRASRVRLSGVYSPGEYGIFPSVDGPERVVAAEGGGVHAVVRRAA